MHSISPTTDSALNHFRLPGLRVVCCEYPAARRDAEGTRAKLEVLADYHVRVIVDLTTAEDGLEPFDPARLELVSWSNSWMGQEAWKPLRWQRPVPDTGTPATLDRLAELVSEVGKELDKGDWIAIHCWGGVGRTGMLGAALLVRYGWPVEEALEAVNDAWRASPKAKAQRHEGRTAPETEPQRQMVRDFAARATPQVKSPNGSGVSAAVTRGCLLGGAIGDAFGAPVEFDSLAQIRAQYGPGGVDTLALGNGGSSRITDDTQMTLFTAEGLLRAWTRAEAKGLCDPPSIIRMAYLRWMHTQGERVMIPQALDVSQGGDTLLRETRLFSRRAPGITCLSALRPGAPHLHDSLRADNNSKGCGTVMRVAPVGLLCEPDQAFELGVEASWLTHGHPVGYLAGGAFAMLVSRVARGARLVSSVEQTAAYVESDAAGRGASGGREVADAMRRGLRLGVERGTKLTAEEIEGLGGAWVAEEALAIAVACAAAFPTDVRGALRSAVNHSGDSDSTGSMTGQLVGAMVGVGGLPPEWRTGVELANVVTAVADDLALGWAPGRWWWKRWPGF